MQYKYNKYNNNNNNMPVHVFITYYSNARIALLLHA